MLWVVTRSFTVRSMRSVSAVVFWQPNISHHMVPLLRQLTEHYHVTLCVLERISERRKVMGWAEPDTTGIVIELVPVEGPELLFEKYHSDSTVHVFSGTSGYPLLWRAFKKGVQLNAKLGFQAETRNWQGFSGLLRLIHSRWEATRIRGSVSFILAMGDRGVAWYRRVGYNPGCIFDWAYFTQPPDYPERVRQDSTRLKILYAGRFSEEKGVVPLIETLRSNLDLPIELHLAGGGPQQDRVLNLINEQSGFIFHGMLEMKAVASLLAEMDYLVVPSTGKDGWAAVVNEALSVGTPCLVSRNAGAASLIVSERLGHTYDPAQRGALIRLLRIISKTHCGWNLNERQWIKEQAQKISPQSGATYLKEIIEHIFLGGQRPNAPWKSIKSY